MALRITLIAAAVLATFALIVVSLVTDNSWYLLPAIAIALTAETFR